MYFKFKKMKLEPIEKDYYYHIYNRGINSTNIFVNKGNYLYFLKLFSKHLSKNVSVYSYCLLKNHFHIIVKINEDGKFVTQKFSNFFNAYAKGFNKANNRTGSLFEKHFKRIKLNTEDYLKNLILYCHLNPQKHKFMDDFENYKFSSYCEIISKQSNLINYDEVIDLFDDIDNFKYVHKYKSIQLSEKYSFE